MSDLKSVAITGGAGYVGSALVPALLERNHIVKVLDLFLYGKEPMRGVVGHPNLSLVEGDIRDVDLLKREFHDVDAVIHLACISNDPSFELNPQLGKSINYNAFAQILSALEGSPARRFIYASSSSVYGLRDEPNVTEDAPKTPLTDYSKYKLMCEEMLLKWGNSSRLDWSIIRPATVCGYAPRLRLDLTVNILTIHALVNKRIRVFGGKQLRPNIHIGDMVRAYIALLEADREKITSKIFNAGYQNESVENIAGIIKGILGDSSIDIDYVPTDDNRSYHVNSDKIARELDFHTTHTIENAVEDIHRAHVDGLVVDGLNNPYYYNIKRMQEIELK